MLAQLCLTALPLTLISTNTTGMPQLKIRLKVFENRVLRRVFGPKRDELTGEWRNLHKRSLMICTPYPILCGW
jgi:hypothetical protein